ncbi:hypothetical protein [uncultured Psychroserpens sp.]|uniref:hypothetical protein n=1 Tax=uncultured Psychroserpens sp. TaxID=255436 RepID=UPI0026238E23|nr:hypothetical protein [uncultured Psychroserpens sp.]
MNAKWYISALILVLTLLGGVASNQQDAVPNQEIVLQLASDDVSSYDTHSTIVFIKQKLQAANVQNIEVQEQQEGQLKISYYSSSDVASIKALLSEDKTLSINYFNESQQGRKFPKEDTVVYNVDVYEIQQGDDLSGIEGKLALETKAENDRFSNPYVFLSSKKIDDKALNRIVKVAYKFNKHIAIAIDNGSYKIPEVRAGPCSLGNAMLG